MNLVIYVELSANDVHLMLVIDPGFFFTKNLTLILQNNSL